MDRNKFRRRNANENLSVNDSGRRRPWAELNVSSVAELRKDFGNRSRSLVLAELQVKHAAKEKEYRALMVSRRSNNNSGSSSNAPAHPVQPSGDRDRGSMKAGKRGHQEKRRRQGRDKFVGISGASSFRFQNGVVGRLYQTPTDDLFIVAKPLLVWPLFPVCD